MKKRKMMWWSTPMLVGGCVIGLGLVLAQAQPTKTDSTPAPTNSVTLKHKSVTLKAKAPAVKAKAKETKKSVAGDPPALTGAELYSINCERCHQERYPTERTGAQWKTILLHMQVRANLPPKEAKLILRFLQENSGR